ncbi:phosphoglycerate mutase-like protein [Didymella exigua CBS 183.55]|uniref:Phosphoglycerate mutase-like protein n=1 Tax=Didymella exigua CBS 183.55 TaxID=1150837 RepID=A0A6A5R844_9PLEO|nr:phosphoglycerate mutase-like protein [Didymella exigua CBS 183.55]KAF1923144.1 phosphoglycerate mutase-like protein [Didymella exigua CBS 183.55]
MPPQQLTLVRHAQGFHNLNIEGHRFHDPRLTLEGHQQCRDLAWKLDDVYSIDCIVASPLRRTLHTALLVFEALLRFKPALRILALPELQETSDLPCDTGSAVADLEHEFANRPVDFSLVPTTWTDKVTGIFSPRSDCIAARCRKARHFLAGLDAVHVAVVAHGAVLHYLTDDWYGATSGIGTGWYNCEARIYHFDTCTDAGIVEASIVETDKSRLERTRTVHRFSKEQQEEMKSEAEASWSRDGYIVLSEGTGHHETDSEESKCGKIEGSKSKWRVRPNGQKCCIL